MESQRQIRKWILASDNQSFQINREGIDFQSSYKIIEPEGQTDSNEINWLGLLPKGFHNFPKWIEDDIQHIKQWARGVRYLRYPRTFSMSHFNSETFPSSFQETDGASTPHLLRTDHDLRNAIQEWFLKTFGINLTISSEGRYSDLTITSPLDGGVNILLDQSGTGLCHVLPVALRSITSRLVGNGVDIIEHPEAELHPPAHTHIADLLMNNLCGSSRPMIIETHSELLLLRIRRRIAEDHLDPDQVLIYWVQPKTKTGTSLQKIKINDLGEMSHWPDDVFSQPYEEVISLRRAVHQKRAMHACEN